MLGSVLAGAVRFRLLLLGLAGGLIVAGVLSLSSTPADVVPELQSAPQLEVQTEALGLSSQEVEQYVTVPLENNLLDGIMGVWDVRSRSIAGLSTVDLLFEPGTSELSARQLVEERLTNAFSLPNVSQPPQLIQPLSSTSRVLLIGLRSESISPLELSYLARWVIKPKLSGVPGVANVSIFAQKDRQIQVLVNPGRLGARHISLSQVINTAGNAQLVSPLTYLQGSSPGTGGFVEGPNQRLDVRPVLPLGAPRNLATVPITGTGGTRLGDVTRVVQGSQPAIGDAVVGGHSGLILEVQKLPGASALGVTDGLDRALAELRPALGGVQIDSSFFRPAAYESDALGSIQLALLIAGILAAVAAGALLLDARALGVAAISAAVALLSALLVLRALGYGINALVILGLLMAVVVVGDDALGAAHEIGRRVRRRGTGDPVEPAHGIVIEACAQLRAPLAYGTLITLIAVIPVLVSLGPSATFVRPMAVAFALAVAVSMAVAVTLTPALGVLLLARGHSRPAPPAARRLLSGYEQLLRRVLALPAGLLSSLCVLGLAGVVGFPFLHQPAPPSFRDRNLVVEWAGPSGASLREMRRVTGRVVAQLRSLPPVADAAATLGRAVGADRIVDSSQGQIYVALKPQADYDRGVAEVRAVVERTPGMHATVSTYESDVMSGVLAPAQQQVQVRIYGEHYGELQRLAAKVRRLMRDVGGTGPSRVQLPSVHPNIEVAVDDGAALRAGVLPGDARRQASTLVSGLTVGNFFQSQAVFDVVVRGEPAVRHSLDDVRNLLIDTARGGQVRLGDIARVSIRPDPTDIRHQALSRYVDVSAPVQSRSLSAIESDLRQQLGRLRFPLGYHAEELGADPGSPTSHAAFLSYALAAALTIFLLLQAALRSWRLAALLFLALPASVSGGLIVALLSGNGDSLATDGALLAVYAFAARQAVLLVTHVRRLQALDAGPLSRGTMIRAASERVAPAAGSALVVASAMLPFIVLGDGAGNELTGTAALVILGGLISALALICLILPPLCLTFGPTEPIAPSDPWEELFPEELQLERPAQPGLSRP